MLLVLPDELLFVTDGRYREQAADELHAAGVERRDPRRPHDGRAVRDPRYRRQPACVSGSKRTWCRGRISARCRAPISRSCKSWSPRPAGGVVACREGRGRGGAHRSCRDHRHRGADQRPRSDRRTSDRARVRARHRHRDPPARRAGQQLRDDRRLRSERREAAPPRRELVAAHRCRRARRHRLRRAGRRLLLGHDAHGRDR